MSKKTWLITGCSSGLGRALATAVLERGENAVITARRVDKVQDIAGRFPDTAQALALDVADTAQVENVVSTAVARFGGIDVLVNNAGHGFRSAVEEGSDDEIRALFDVNFFGAVSLIQTVLPGMRARRSGLIANVSSIGARAGVAGSGFYAASKCALEGMSACLRQDVESLGIKVVVVEPGQFRTDFYGRSLTQSSKVIDDYAETAGRRRIENAPQENNQIGDPARGARVMIRAFEDAEPPRLLLLGSDAVRVVNGALSADQEEVARWQWLSETSDFPEQ